MFFRMAAGHWCCRGATIGIASALFTTALSLVVLSCYKASSFGPLREAASTSPPPNRLLHQILGTPELAWGAKKPAAHVALKVPARTLGWNIEETTLLQREQPQGPGASGGPGGASSGSATPGGAGGRQPRRSLGYYGPPRQCTGETPVYPSGEYKAEELIIWKPRPDRYLLGVCHSGQLNNQVLCMNKYFLLAALLNRTLVVPTLSFWSPRFAWDLSLDIPYARACLGDNAVISLDELRGRLAGAAAPLPPAAGAVHVDEVICFPQSPHAKYCDPNVRWSIEGLNLTLPPEAGRKGVQRFMPEMDLPAAEFVEGARSAARVLAFDDMFAPAIMDVPSGGPYFPLQSHCAGGRYFQAHPTIRAAAQGMADDVLGGEYLAFHFRRGDFYSFQAKDHKIFYWPSIPEVGATLATFMAAHNLSRVFVATNAHSYEMALLQKVLAMFQSRSGRPLEMATLPKMGELPPATRAQPWARAWREAGLGDNQWAPAILEKLVCTRAKIFVGTAGSTFSSDVYRIRWADKTATCDDGEFWHMRAAVQALRKQ